MIVPLFGILVRFRFPRKVIVGDIEKAFHQIPLQEEYRNLAMFLWVKDVDKPPTRDNIEAYRFKRVPFGMTSSPFLLAASINYQLDNNPHELNEEIKENLYVDNCMFCTNDESAIPRIVSEAKQVFNRLGMNLREFITNSPEAMAAIPEADRAKSDVIKLLGYKWDTVTDTITIKIAELNIDHPTKRDVASKLAETFDPLGLVSPIQVPFKRLMQRTWQQQGSDWKAPLPNELLQDWRALRTAFIDRVITVRRPLTPDYSDSRIELLMFSDASHDIYAALCYANFIRDGQPPVTQLLASKNKVKPSKELKWTIPKLELLGIVCASNLARSIIAELRVPIAKVRLFTDSSCALYWILSGQNTRQWVANRTGEIKANQARLLECNIETTIHHCPTKENPADLATRGMTTTELQNSSLWFNGPEFLQKDHDEWPCMINGTVSCPAEFQELVYAEIIDPATQKRKKPLMEKAAPPECNESVMSMTATIASGEKQPSFIPFTATNSLSKLVTVVTIILRTFSKTLKKKQWETPLMKEFTASEDPVHQAKVARFLIIKEHYKDAEYLGLKFPSSLSPYMDSDGLYRVQRQIDSPVLPQEAHRPILIHHDHQLAKLIVLETHEINGHLPENYTRAVLRTKYWTAQDGMLAKKVIGKCIACKITNGYPFAYPFTATLPSCRTTPSKPFSKVGLDYYGPIVYLRDDRKSYGKAYVLIYTCLATRGALLRLVPNANSETYVKTLKMIFTEVGVPSEIYSDNAGTFKLGAAIINKDIDHFVYSNTLTQFLATTSITCRYITPLAPWQGGIYERIVQLAKRQVLKECGSRVYEYHDLSYVISGAQGMINNRPLIPHARSPGDLIALRPIDFINPGVMTEIPSDHDEPPNPTGVTEASVRAHLNNLEATLERVWKLWSIGYLTFMREAMHQNRRCSTLVPEVGQLVIISVNLLKRHKWPLGVITKVNKSARDGQVRSATVMCRGTLVERPVCQLIPLELTSLNHQCNKDMSEDIKSNDAGISETEAPGLIGVTNPKTALPTPATLESLDITYAPELFPANVLPNIAAKSANHPAEKGTAEDEPEDQKQSNKTQIGTSTNPENLILEDAYSPEDGVYQDPQNTLPDIARDYGAENLPEGRSRDYHPRRAKATHINYVHTADMKILSRPSPPECCQLYHALHSFDNLKAL
ncbi:hypothetical protein CRE_11624 [Caenorhabditis remanei]|uniref:Integrase catalytic domain-containing protein n=1 Tax=Caenorhabditis remanei TaxID=31234 RepID=E3NU72_CAERE|nr:hypothetical protein CRE_11624 [Caenorhabditis remanei]